MEGLVVIVGAYGSGKTEVSIHLAYAFKNAGSSVWIADLDLVNPYFRTREARASLMRMGIEVVLPPEAYLNADLPILSPVVAGVIRKREGVVILDVGGNDVGATVLASLEDAFRATDTLHRPLHVLFVINPFRPFTDSFSGCLKMRNAIENASKQRVTGIIGNPNLMEETTLEVVLQGYDFLHHFSKESGLPLKMITVPQALLDRLGREAISCPVLPIQRQLSFPWSRPSGIFATTEGVLLSGIPHRSFFQEKDPSQHQKE